MKKKIIIISSLAIFCFGAISFSLAYNRTELQDLSKDELINLVVSLTQGHECSLKTPEYCTKTDLVTLVQSVIVTRKEAIEQATTDVQSATQDEDLLKRFGAKEIEQNNLPESISFWVEASCPGSTLKDFEYTWIPEGYEIASCKEGEVGTHGGCENCTMSNVELLKSTPKVSIVDILNNNIPNSINAEYISLYSIPEISVIEGDIEECEGETENIDGKDYCLTVQTGKAVGSTYSDYKYTINENGENLEIKFILKIVNCENLEEPLLSVCEKEQEQTGERYYANSIIEQIFSSKTICTAEYDPVCGEDGITYSNECFANEAEVEISYLGSCQDEVAVNIDAITPSSSSVKGNSFIFKIPSDDSFEGATEYTILCGETEGTYSIEESVDLSTLSILSKYVKIENLESETNYYCMAQLCKDDDCYDGKIIALKTGLAITTEDVSVIPEVNTPIEEICTAEYDPVCGEDGITYSNECFANEAEVEIVYNGKCEIVESSTSLIIDTKVSPCGNVGDVNLDGFISDEDATMINNYISGNISNVDMEIADVDNNGVITSTDASYVKNYVEGNINTFPACNITSATNAGGSLIDAFKTFVERLKY